MRRMRSSSVIVACVLLSGLARGGAVEVPEPAIPPGYKPLLNDDERGLWLEMQDFERELQRSPLLVRDQDINEYIKRAACNVAGPYCSDVRVYVLRNAGFNASMAPNGMMLVWTGTLTRVRNEDELATILGHEIAHFARAHSISQWRMYKSSMTAGQILSFGIGFASGVYLPVGESLAVLGALSFSRDQEQEADLLGAQMMAEVGLDPHASYRVWQMLSEEEERAIDKGDKGLSLFRTHPKSEDRLKTLRDWAVERFGSEREPRSDARYVELLSAHYRMLMDDQIDTNRYSRTEVLLERHAALGIDPALINYYRGEMHRQRGAQGDAEQARDAYLSSISTGRSVPEAYRNVGYLYLKAGNSAAARENFRKYLEAAPAADDRSMIESYLVDE